uniref:C-type lectin domain-containing protein n=1 Tax=Oryzias latipes TaxID=8090 RepID=A0A3P9MAE9_ORYLA
MFILFIYISFFSFLSFLPTVCQTCPKDWIQFQKSCYFFNHFISQWKTWDQSRQFCQSNKSDLVVISSLEEQTFIKNTIQYYYDIWHGYWIGLQKVNNKKTEGRFEELQDAKLSLKGGTRKWKEDIFLCFFFFFSGTIMRLSVMNTGAPIIRCVHLYKKSLLLKKLVIL